MKIKEIKETIKSLASSQGFYGRLLASMETNARRVKTMEKFKADTIGALFESTNDYYITVSLTDNYCLYIEGLNEDYVSLVNNFKVEDIRHLMIELNDYNGNICITIQNYAELQGVGLETTIDDLKERVLDLAINKSILNG